MPKSTKPSKVKSTKSCRSKPDLYLVRKIRENPTKNYQNIDELKFFVWMSQVEGIISKKFGPFMKLDDFPDELYRDSYDDGVHYKKMAQVVINNFLYI